MNSNGTNKSETAASASWLPPDDLIFGRSLLMKAVRLKAEKIASANIPVLIQGPAGTGKEVLARWIHTHSPRNANPYVRVNCAAIPATLLESELFGYEKGAFSGANSTKPGRVELAHNGTLFLDEIAEIDLSLQAKLLQFMQDGQLSRIGEREERRIDARVICATNRTLEREIQTGGFRSDLFYRINVVQLQMPALQARREDIPLLADYFLRTFNARFERQSPQIDEKMKEFLQFREWPGNIRELENWAARHVLLGGADPVVSSMPARFPSKVSARNPDGTCLPLKRITKDAIQQVEKQLILEVLQANRWNRRKAAEVLKISYRALIYKIREASLSPKRPRNGSSQNAEVLKNPSSE
jgi:two-component system, NtrC family, response regulator AtoC